MSTEYARRYQVSFVAFMNCPDPAPWVNHGKKHWEWTGAFRMLFTGAVYDSCNMESIVSLAKTVDRLNRMNQLRCTMEIQTNSGGIDTLRQYLKQYRGVSVESVSSDQTNVARCYGEADVLILPFDFGKRSQVLQRYSMPTKLPAYLLSGTPLFVYGPIECSAVSLIEKHQLGFVVGQQCDEVELASRILDASQNDALRRDYGRRARSFAQSNMAAASVRASFRKAIRTCASEDEK